MWPFSKKRAPAIKLPAGDGCWSILQGENNGMPLLIRVDTAAKRPERHMRLPIRLGIAIPLHSPNELGLPEKAEAEQLSAIEDRLDDAIGASGDMVLIITNAGMREFVSYVASAQIAQQIVARVCNATPSHEVQHYIESDPEWMVYGEYKKLCKTN